MKIEQIHSHSQNSNLFFTAAGNRIFTILARVACVTVVLLGMVGCAESVDDNDLAATDEEATEEALQAIDAVAPIAPQDPGTTLVTGCPSGCTNTTQLGTSTDPGNE